MRKSSKTNKAICKICGKEFMTLKSKFCSLTCRNIDYGRKDAEKLDGIEGEDFIVCKWCGLKVKRMYGSHLKTHHPGKTTTDYKNEFPNAKLACSKDNKNVAKAYIKFAQSEDGRKFLSERVKGENNPNSKEKTSEKVRKSRSPFSKEMYIKKGLTEEEARFEVSKFVRNALKDRLTETQFEYWLNRTRGNVEESMKLYKERQATFTLEKCIIKYGEEKGRKLWIDRQNKWIKNYRKKSYSFISQDLFWKLYEEVSFNSNEIKFATFNNGKITESVNINNEEKLFLDNRLVLPDFIHLPSKKIIEFDGVYYHRKNPENKKREQQRDKDLERNGYKVFHVNESEYRQNPQQVVEKCKQFLEI